MSVLKSKLFWFCVFVVVMVTFVPLWINYVIVCIVLYFWPVYVIGFIIWWGFFSGYPTGYINDGRE